MQSLDTSKIKAIVFDMDGTLVHTTDVGIKAWNKILKNRVKNVEKYFGPTIEEMLIQLKNENKITGKPSFWIKLWHKAYSALISGKRLIDSDTIKTIKYLSKKYTLGIITSSDRYTVNVTLKKYIKYFDFIITADDVNKGKPNPEGLNDFIYFTRFKPNEIIYIGDNIRDIQFGKNAKTYTVGKVDFLYSKKELKGEHPNLIIDKISDLKKWF